jgi:hypothetical protein
LTSLFLALSTAICSSTHCEHSMWLHEVLHTCSAHCKHEQTKSINTSSSKKTYLSASPVQRAMLRSNCTKFSWTNRLEIPFDAIWQVVAIVQLLPRHSHDVSLFVRSRCVWRLFDESLSSVACDNKTHYHRPRKKII